MNIDLAHLSEECEWYEEKVTRPVIFTEATVSEVVNALNKVLVEGISVKGLRKYYEAIYSTDDREDGYLKWKSINLIQGILKKQCPQIQDIDKVMAPLYLLYDYRNLADHLTAIDILAIATALAYCGELRSTIDICINDVYETHALDSLRYAQRVKTFNYGKDEIIENIEYDFSSELKVQQFSLFEGFYTFYIFTEIYDFIDAKSVKSFMPLLTNNGENGVAGLFFTSFDESMIKTRQLIDFCSFISAQDMIYKLLGWRKKNVDRKPVFNNGPLSIDSTMLDNTSFSWNDSSKAQTGIERIQRVKHIGEGLSGVVGRELARNVNSSDKFDEIKKYKELLDMGVITKDEFDRKKKELLDL